MARFGRHLGAVVVIALAAATAAAQTPKQWAAARNLLVERDLATAGIKHPAVLAAMREVPRHEFVPAELREYAYLDISLPIGLQQTISPPYIVAWMTQQLDPQPAHRVLEVGTGSGYQAAVLSRLVGQVYTIEIHAPLARRAQRVIDKLDYRNVHIRIGDGYAGWQEHAPFDRIIVTCSPEKVPVPLIEQLTEGGRMIIPLGERYQQALCVLSKRDGKLVVESREATYFVPMTGRAESLRSEQPELPLTPLANGDFERLLEPGKPAAWYYLRQATIEQDGPAPDAGHHLTLSNEVPGRGAQALQSVGVDGRRVQELQVSLRAKATDIEPAKTGPPGAHLVVSFFDELRMPLREESIGPWRGSFDWQQKTARIPVPPTARGAAVIVSLMGSTGKLSCDQIELRVATPHTAKGGR